MSGTGRESSPGVGRQPKGEVASDCSVCGDPIALASDGVPYHLGCVLDGDHDICDPDDRHIPA